MTIDISKYAGQIRAILQAPGVDLSTISAKRVRKQLVEDNEELTAELVKEYKDDIDALIGSVYEKVSGAGGDEDHDGTSKRKHAVGEDEPGTPSTKKTKKNSEKRDAEFARQLSKELNGNERKPRAAAPKKAVARRGKKGAKSSATIDSDGEGSVDPEAKPKRRGGFTKEYLLSEPLSALLGVTQLSRPQAVKHIWVYIKEKDLQNPSDKREIICDEKMKNIFRVDKIGMFKMNQMLGEHLQEPAPTQPTPEAA
ncbi:hypothetical protein PHLGIDRAFT_96142 [Phlebiopsis gigantea 11061_1 CR5-6]|uniref:DM2 domain-containing protein n=1 Tax=Phlebiopsis gigantea (strain 11061_1 CR5-6) TaxID=745531 RepID=A0A0C3PBI0_PHLG1|nr:hypothetical protein PHLGIDRAFT_96142 [Phlebiopsis gigantea 11061_1 CR5-6]